MYHSPSWFVDQANNCFTPKESSESAAAVNYHRTYTATTALIKYRVVRIEMQFTSNIIALALQSRISSVDSEAKAESQNNNMETANQTRYSAMSGAPKLNKE